jgi:hypothetical protein
MILAFIAIRGFLHDAGEDHYSEVGLPFVALSAALYAVLPGMELGAIAAVDMGASVAQMEESLDPWFVPILMSSALLNLIGLVWFARGIRAARVLAPTQTTLVVTALVVMALARFVPLGAVQFYLQGTAGMVALWTIARAIRAGVSHPRTAQARAAAAI